MRAIGRAFAFEPRADRGGGRAGLRAAAHAPGRGSMHTRGLAAACGRAAACLKGQAVRARPKQLGSSLLPTAVVAMLLPRVLVEEASSSAGSVGRCRGGQFWNGCSIPFACCFK